MTRKERRVVRSFRLLKSGAKQRMTLQAQIADLEEKLLVREKQIAMLKMDRADLRQHYADLSKEKTRLLELLEALLPWIPAAKPKAPVRQSAGGE